MWGRFATCRCGWQVANLPHFRGEKSSMFFIVLLFQVAAGGLALLFAGLLVILLLQASGVLKKIPFNYNLRNLFVRWRITLMTALAFTLVVGLMTVLLAFVNGMYKLTASSGIP